MLEELLPETWQIIHTLEIEAGKPVIVLPTGKKIESESPNSFLRISYTASSPSVDYEIAREALCLLRYLEVPEQEHWVVRSTDETRLIAYSQMGNDTAGFSPLIREQCRKAYSAFFDDVLLSLVRVPSDVWVNHKMVADYPGLRPSLVASLDEHFRIGEYRLRRQRVPISYFVSVNVLHAAYALAMDELLGAEKYFSRYLPFGLGEISRELKEANGTDRGVRGDWETVDRWAGRLGIIGWFEWVKMA